MATITIKEVQNDRWGNCLYLSNGEAELLVTLDFGPRIIRLSSPGGTNLFFEDTDSRIGQEGDAFAPVGGGRWNIYGGHRLWTSPEHIPRTTYPDNSPVEWKQIGQSTIVLSAVEETWNQITKQIEIQLAPADAAGIKVVHRITNNGAWPISFAPWALSVMGAGGRAVVPMNGSANGLMPNRRFILWPYTRLNDSRVSFSEDAIFVDQGEGPTPYKFGSDNEAGWAAYSNHGDTFIKTYEPVSGGSYPDFGVSFELYTNSLMLELETLGELREVSPGETVEHVEKWKVVQGLDVRNIAHEEALVRLADHVKK
ncbi:hypothetical protein D7Z26_25075 [Cohnella endophytica]|uniref:DUF4380 domain-containing protein n=1 Tax=Cohnella endophytica TaxID=2419778 RepID=A0A494XBG3_9BACL|nr:hypothetical protein [Cohnella endophytica]RKP45826.1 hypothetical protein D7Z26_25075 [Cohnella endophytica]